MDEDKKIDKFSQAFDSLTPLKRKEFSKSKRVDAKIVLDYIKTQKKLKFN